jgi:hypothetical protein
LGLTATTYLVTVEGGALGGGGISGGIEPLEEEVFFLLVRYCHGLFTRVTYSIGVVLGGPECFSVVGIISSGKPVLTTIVEVRDTVSDERVGVGVVDLLQCQPSPLSSSRQTRLTDRSVTIDSNRGLSWLFRKEPYKEGSVEFPATCRTICETSSRLPTELLKARVKG